MTTASHKTNRGLGCLVLFALPFAAVGVVMAVLIGRAVWQYVEMRHWREVPATIVRVELETHQDDSTTYQVLCTFTYELNGRKFTADRVGIHSFADNIGSYQQDNYDELRRYRDKGKPYRCFVDPDAPREAILDRGLRWGLLAFMALFGVVFGGVGFGLIAAGIFGGRVAQKNEARRVAAPDQPWLWKEEWVRGEIGCGDKSRLFGLATFALIWNLVSSPVIFFLPEEVIEKENWLALLALVFPLVGIGLIIAVLYVSRRMSKFGRSTFQMASVPGVIGGQLAGVVRIPKHIVPEDGFRVQINCLRQSTDSEGHRRETVVWQDERVMSGSMSAESSEMALPVLFAIPFDCQPTTPDDDSTGILWRLEATAAVPGVDYHGSFEVPVFKTDESRPDFQLDESLIASYVARPDSARLLSNAGITEEPLPGKSVRLIFPMARNLGATLGLTFFLTIWSGAIALMVHLGAPILFPIVFGLFELLLVWVTIDLWFYASQVEASPAGLAIRGGLLGLGRTHWIDADEIVRLETKSEMQSGTKVWNDILVRCQGGQQHTIGKRLPDRQTERVVIERLEEILSS